MHNIRLLAPRSHGGHNSISISGTQPRSRHRPQRRITGYHNPFDDEQLPSSEQGHVPELSLQEPASSDGQTHTPQRPPPYSCTVFIEGVVEMRFERTSPFNTVKDAKWENVYLRLQGTMLELRQAKTHGLFTPGSVRGTVTGEPGKLLKKFTMQHAEAGVAADYRKVEMIPKSPISQLLPASTIKELQRTDPQQFEVIHNYVSRLRLEGNQFLLRFKTCEERSEWLSQICAAIDIAPSLETRGEPRYHTLPRRRRRDHHQEEPLFEDTEHDASLLLAEQEQILQSRYPHLANSNTGQNERPNSTEESRPDMNTSAMGEGETEEDDPDREDLDPAFMGAGDNDEAIVEEDDWQEETGIGRSNLLDGGPRPQRAARKWRPSINLDPSRDARYRRRCMPMLVYNSRYANDILYCDGKRVTIDWKTRTLQAWPTPPPAYNPNARDGDDSNSSRASTTVRPLARQSSVTDFAPSVNRSIPHSSMPTAASSADVTDGSEDDRSPTSLMTSLKGTTSWSRRFKHLGKPSLNPRNIPRSDGTSMNVNKVRSKDSGNWQLKSVPNSGRLLSASLLDDRELRNLRV